MDRQITELDKQTEDSNKSSTKLQSGNYDDFDISDYSLLSDSSRTDDKTLSERPADESNSLIDMVASASHDTGFDSASVSEISSPEENVDVINKLLGHSLGHKTPEIGQAEVAGLERPASDNAASENDETSSSSTAERNGEISINNIAENKETSTSNITEKTAVIEQSAGIEQDRGESGVNVDSSASIQGEGRVNVEPSASIQDLRGEETASKEIEQVSLVSEINKNGDNVETFTFRTTDREKAGEPDSEPNVQEATTFPTQTLQEQRHIFASGDVEHGANIASSLEVIENSIHRQVDDEMTSSSNVANKVEERNEQGPLAVEQYYEQLLQDDSQGVRTNENNSVQDNHIDRLKEGEIERSEITIKINKELAESDEAAKTRTRANLTTDSVEQISGDRTSSKSGSGDREARESLAGKGETGDGGTGEKVTRESLAGKGETGDGGTGEKVARESLAGKGETGDGGTGEKVARESGDGDTGRLQEMVGSDDQSDNLATNSFPEQETSAVKEGDTQVVAEGQQTKSEKEVIVQTSGVKVEESGVGSSLDEPIDRESTASKVEAEISVKEDKEASREDDPVVDILGNGLLKKKILTQGKGADTRPTNGDIVTIRVDGQLSDGSHVDTGELTFVLNDGDVILAFDLAVALMEEGEKCELVTSERYAYGSLGREPDIPKDSSIKYVIELLSIQKPQDVTEMSFPERLKMGEDKRARGNYLFGRSDFTGAINFYNKAIKLLDNSALNEGIDNSSQAIVTDSWVKCYNNLAACQLKIHAADEAIKSCEKVLSFEANNVEALARLGKAFAAKGEIETAIKQIRSALKFDPESKLMQQELQNLVRRRTKEVEMEKVLYQKMVGVKQKQKVSAESKKQLNSKKLGCVTKSFILLAICFFIKSGYVVSLDENGQNRYGYLMGQRSNLWLFVIDTNVYIHDLAFVKGLVRSLREETLTDMMVIVPWVVLEEVDRLKNRHSDIVLSNRAVKAVRFLHTELRHENPLVIGQPSPEAVLALEAFKVPLSGTNCSDNELLATCYQLKDSHPVLLITNDVHLVTKAGVNGIQATSSQDASALMELYRQDRPANLPAPNFYKSILKTPSTSQKGGMNLTLDQAETNWRLDALWNALFDMINHLKIGPDSGTIVKPEICQEFTQMLVEIRYLLNSCSKTAEYTTNLRRLSKAIIEFMIYFEKFNKC